VAASAVTSLDIDAGSTTGAGSFVPDTGYYTAVHWPGTEAVSNAISTSGIANPPPQAALQTQRYATTLTYTIPNLVPSASYNVRLDFVESYFHAAGKRVFSGTINGVHVFSNLDIYASAGGTNIALAKQYSTTADATGKITIVMTASVNNASIAALEINAAAAASPSPSPLPSPSPSATPSDVIAINAGGSNVGSLWAADTDYTMGGWSGVSSVSNAIDTSGVSNPAPQGVYQDQRWAYALTYALPKLTPNAAYTVRLHFVESYWAAAGRRLFNVNLNGTTVLSNFDIFASAGGKNIAIVKQFSANADATGTITVKMQAAIDNATIAGIEVLSGSGAITPSPSPSPTATPIGSSSPTPRPSPTSTPTAAPTGSGDALPGVFAQEFPTSPLVTQLSTVPASRKNVWAAGSSVATAAWNDEVAGGNTSAGYWSSGPFGVTRTFPGFPPIPLYVSSNANDVLVGVTCVYDPSCNVMGYQIYINPADTAQPQTDHHLLVMDTRHNVEVDCWQVLTNDGSRDSTSGNLTPDLRSGSLSCAYAGFYPLGSSGIHGNYNNASGTGDDGIKFGPAAGSFLLTPQEMLNGHIDHALGLVANCANVGMMYPADNRSNTDGACANGAGNGPSGSSGSPHYGSIFQLSWSDAKIASSAYSKECKAVLTAMAHYGAYISDTADEGTAMQIEGDEPYVSDALEMGPDPWPAVLSDLQAAGDASGGGYGSATWNYCFTTTHGKLGPADFNLVELKPPS
jgi:hypothetical protein